LNGARTSPAGAIDGTAAFLAVLLATTAWKSWAASALPLINDECYYWIWSLNPQLGYYDHPPLVAWAIAAGRSVFGHSELAVRAPAILSGIILALAGRSLAGSLYGAAAANRAGIFLLLAPIFAGNAFLMTPDTFLAPAFCLAMLFAWKGLQPASPFAWWFAAGAAAGAGALSKYTMVLFFGGLGLLWLASPGNRWRIFLGALCAGLVALAVFSPVIIWNAQNDWASFGFQFRQGFRNQQQSLVNFDKLASYAAFLVVITTPVLGILCFRAAATRLREPRFLYPAVFFWTVVAFFAFSAAKAKIEANWPMSAFIGGLLLAAGAWESFGTAWRKWALGLLLAADLAAVAGISLLSLPAGSPLSPRNFLPVPSGRTPPPGLAGALEQGLTDLRLKLGEVLDQRETGAAIEKAFRESRADFVCATGYQLAGITAFYAPALEPFLWLPSEGRTRLRWIDDTRWAGQDALIVSRHKNPKKDFAFFAGSEPLPPLDIPGARPVFAFLAESYTPPPRTGTR
jgi:4-amino-4-deoxy-L-arabinose transferase-like glycosyltransferase